MRSQISDQRYLFVFQGKLKCVIIPNDILSVPSLQSQPMSRPRSSNGGGYCMNTRPAPPPQSEARLPRPLLSPPAPSRSEVGV